MVESEPDEDSITPWLALFPFDCNSPNSATQELRLTDAQLGEVRSLLHLAEDAEPGPAFTITATVKDYISLLSQAEKKTTGTPFTIPDFSKDDNWENIKADTTPVEVIFLKGSLFKSLFYAGDTPDIKQFRYCAHVRNINTSGITNAGTEDTGIPL